MEECREEFLPSTVLTKAGHLASPPSRQLYSQLSLVPTLCFSKARLVFCGVAADR